MSNDRYSRTLLGVKRIHNLRDVGGVPIDDGGHIREGVLFRSAQLGPHEAETIDQLRVLDLDMIFDLRSSDESDRVPDVVPEGVHQEQLDVLADSEERIATSLEDIFERPEEASELLASGLVADHYTATYRNLVSLNSARASYRRLFSAVAAGQRTLFHCTAGKDRTGWAAASLQLLLGVPRDAVVDHFLASNSETIELFGAVMEAFADAGGDADALAPVFMVDAAYLNAAIGEMQRLHGSIEAYFLTGLGLDEQTIGSLAGHLVES